MTLQKVHEIFMVDNLKVLSVSRKRVFFSLLFFFAWVEVKVEVESSREKVLDRFKGFKFSSSK